MLGHSIKQQKAGWSGGVLLLFAALTLLGVYLIWQESQVTIIQTESFSGERAYEDVLAQMAFGPRTPGSPAHAAAVEWMVAELQAAGWRASMQEAAWEGQAVRNVVAEHGSGQPWVLLGAHYDSRIYADRDPDPARQQEPVPGANDGASGVAVLLEIARVLPADYPGRVTIVLFDAEDSGGISGWDWIMGSRAYAASLDANPDAMVLVDLVGDADLSLPYDGNSEEALRAENIIDLDYAYWHTVEDTADKVSAESLQIVGDVVLAWLLGRE